MKILFYLFKILLSDDEANTEDNFQQFTFDNNGEYFNVNILKLWKCCMYYCLELFLFYLFYFRTFSELKVKHEQLQLITPQFETPLPPLQPAVSQNEIPS